MKNIIFSKKIYHFLFKKKKKNQLHQHSTIKTKKKKKKGKQDMNQQMPETMVKSRSRIMRYLAEQKNISEISRLTGHSRTLIRKIKGQIERNEDVFALQKHIGAPKKVTEEIKQNIIRIAINERGIGLKQIAAQISEKFRPISYNTARNVLNEINFPLSAPQDNTSLTQKQIQSRLSFAQNHLENLINWDSVLFTDEAVFLCNESGIWSWKKRNEYDEKFFMHKGKTTKVILFGGISTKYRTPLVSVVDNIDPNTYIDEFIDGSGLIPSMNDAYGANQWYLVLDGTTFHTNEVASEYLKNYCTVIPDWPLNSPDLNPVENLMEIINNAIVQSQPKTANDLISVAFNAWEAIELQTINDLINSMNDRLQKIVQNNGAKEDNPIFAEKTV